MPKLRPIGHEDRLSVVDHLDELRGRLILCGVVLVVAFGFCYWQNNLILNALNSPLLVAVQDAGQPPRRADQRRGQGGQGPARPRRGAERHLAVDHEHPLRSGPGAAGAGRPLRRPRRPGSAPEDPQEPADHDRRRRGLHHHADGVLLLRAAALAAGDPLSGLRVRDPGAQPRRAARGPAGDARRAGPVRGRRRVHLPGRLTPGRAVPPGLQRQTSSTPSSGPSRCTPSRC